MTNGKENNYDGMVITTTATLTLTARAVLLPSGREDKCPPPLNSESGYDPDSGDDERGNDYSSDDDTETMTTTTVTCNDEGHHPIISILKIFIIIIKTINNVNVKSCTSITK